MRDLTADQIFVEALRAALRLQPLYKQRPDEPCGTYLSRERYLQLADPRCDTCDGFGYYDGELLDMRCHCTGLAQRDSRAKNQRASIHNPSFGGVRG